MKASSDLLVRQFTSDGYADPQARRLADWIANPVGPYVPESATTEIADAPHDYEPDGKPGGRCVHCRKHRRSHELENSDATPSPKVTKRKGKTDGSNPENRARPADHDH
jgi:hypothetical protein